MTQVAPGSESPSVDFLILADRAESLNGKVYMMGGGWDRLYVPDFAQPQSISIAVGILVPWNATNQNHSLTGRIEDDDGQEITNWSLSFNAGRPPLLVTGQQQRVILAFQVAIILPGLGTYAVIALINDNESKRAAFYAQLLPPPPVAPQR